MVWIVSGFACRSNDGPRLLAGLPRLSARRTAFLQAVQGKVKG
jgi:hypothetical protein